MLPSEVIQELFALQKKSLSPLNEAARLTDELQEASLRQDQVTLELLFSMRQRAILELQEIHNFIDLLRLSLEPAAVAQLNALLAGEAASVPAERDLAGLIASNRRLLGRLLSQDRRLNEMLCGESSIYRQDLQGALL